MNLALLQMGFLRPAPPLQVVQPSPSQVLQSTASLPATPAPSLPSAPPPPTATPISHVTPLAPPLQVKQPSPSQVLQSTASLPATPSSATGDASTIPATFVKLGHNKIDPLCAACVEPQSGAAEHAEPLRRIAHDDITSEVVSALLQRVLSIDQSDEEGGPLVPEGLLCSVGRALPAVRTEEGREIARKAEAYFAILEILELIPGAAGKRWAEMAAESPKPPAVLWRAHRMNLALLQMGFLIERARSRTAARWLTEQLVKRHPVMWYGRGAGEDVRGWMWLDGGPLRGWVDWEKPEDMEWHFTLEDGWALEPTPASTVLQSMSRSTLRSGAVA